MPTIVTVSDSIHIEAADERVWDFTRDWKRRLEWDPTLISFEPEKHPEPRVYARTRMGSGTVISLEWNRPHRWRERMGDLQTGRTISRSTWNYVPEENGTRLTLENTLELRWSSTLGRALTRWRLRSLTRRTLANLKRLLETE